MAGTNYTADKNAYNAAINTDISTQTGPNTVPPEVVGSGYTDLADLLEPYINRINNQAILSGASVPSNALGSDLDLYYRSQPTFFELYRKEGGVWVLKVTISFNVTLPEGNLTVRTSIDGFIVTATKGGWVIDNNVYQKNTQTQLLVDSPDLNFGRIDNIYADTSGNILYEVGTPYATPVAPALPINTILIDQVIVPASSSGDDPYLLFGGGSPASDSLNFANSTGLITGGVLSINADNTKFDVSAGTAVFVDYTAPIPPTPPTAVNFGPLTAVVTINLNSSPVSYIGVNGSGSIVQQITPFTPTQRRSIATLGILIHTNLTVINAVNSQGSNILAPGDQLHDFMEAVGPLNQSGNKYSAASTDLTIQKTAGTIFKFGCNSADYTNPHTTSQLASNPTTFRYRTQLGEVSGDVTNINPGQYDNAGVLTAVAANDWTIQRITVFQTGLTRIQYGQTVYASFAAAQAALFTESFVVESNIAANGIFRAYLIVKGNATNLSLSAQAVFQEVPKFGGALGASGTPLNVILNQSTLQVGANFNIDGLGQTQGGFASVGSVSNYAGLFTGTSAAPDTSGSAVNGAISVRATGITTTALAFGVDGTGLYGWIQARNPNDYSVNRELRLNQNGGQVIIGGGGSAISGSVRSILNNPTLIATANNDILIGLDINLTTSLGSFTGVQTPAIRAIVNNPNSISNISIKNTSSLSGSALEVSDNTGSRFMVIGVKASASTFDGSYGIIGEGFIRSSFSATGLAISAATGPIRFINSGGTEQFRLFTNGNALLQNGGTYIDNGYRLDVQGNGIPSRISGQNASPSNSGSALNGSLTLNSTLGAGTSIGIGIDGTNNYAWLQARNPSDYSVNRELRLNPNGGIVEVSGNNAADGLAIYNTVDRVTNYERIRMFYSGNVFNIKNEFAGTGIARTISIGTLASTVVIREGASILGGIQISRSLTTSGSSTLALSGTFTNTSGINNTQAILPTISQTNTAGYRCLLLSPFEQTTGTGTKFLIDAGTNSAADGGGTHTSRFSVDNLGNTIATKYSVSALNTAPATATDTGTTGEIRYTATHIYLCTATNTWVRADLATF